MAEEENIDIRQKFEELLASVQPNLQNVIRRSFTNVAVRQSKNVETTKAEMLDDTSYFAKHTQVNLSRLELIKKPTFHIQSLSLDLKSMNLSLKCSLGEVNVKGIYSAFNENLYNLIPVMAEGHMFLTLMNVVADVHVGLTLEDDSFSFINPSIDFAHDEVLVKLTWPSPQKNGGYEFITTQQIAKHIDDLPISAALSLSLFGLLQRHLEDHLGQALRQSASVSELMGCDERLLETYRLCYRDTIEEMTQYGNKVIDLILINVRRTLLQNCREIVEVPPLNIIFLHKIGSVWYTGRFSTEAGWVRGAARVSRLGPVTVTARRPDRTSLRVTLHLKNLQLVYETYRMKCAGAASTGRAAGEWRDCALQLALTVGLSRWEPYAQLDDLRINSLSDMETHVSGLGGAGLGAMGAALRGAARSLGAPALEAALAREMHAALAALPLWDLLHAKHKH